jgi:DNA-directed RNA polymerase specialized sigma54-like protein
MSSQANHTQFPPPVLEPTRQRIADAFRRLQAKYLATRIPTDLAVVNLEDVADETANDGCRRLHPCTISRALNARDPLRVDGLLASGLVCHAASRATNSITSDALDGWLESIVASEDRPLSDAAIAKEIEREHDLKVSREIVKKRRVALGIESSRTRRTGAVREAPRA